MLLKKKSRPASPDPKLQAGETASQQMATRLEQVFGAREDVFLMHDVSLHHGQRSGRIDHLIISRYGVVLVESRSLYGKILLAKDAANQLRWAREQDGKLAKIPSPILIMEGAHHLLQDLLITHREDILGRSPITLQKGFRCCPFNTYVAEADGTVIKTSDRKKHLPAGVLKAEEVVAEIVRLLKEREKSDILLPLNRLKIPPWSITQDEAKVAAELVLSWTTPAARRKNEVPKRPLPDDIDRSCPLNPAPPSSSPQPNPQPFPRHTPRAAPPVTAPPPPAPPPAPVVVPPPGKPGDLCPKCGTRTVAVATAGPVRMDGSRARFLACVGNRDKSCNWVMPYTAAATVSPPPRPPAPPAPSAPVVRQAGPTSTPTKLEREVPPRSAPPQTSGIYHPPPPPPAPPPPRPAPPVAPSPTPTRSLDYFCNSCQIQIHREEAKYCWYNPDRFGGNTYCKACQEQFPVKPRR